MTFVVSPATPLPFDLDRLPSDVASGLVDATMSVLVRDPLPPGELPARVNGDRDLPEALPRVLAIHGTKQTGKTSLALFVQRTYRGVVEIGFSAAMIDEANAYLAPYGHQIDDGNKSEAVYRYLLQMWAQARRCEDERYWVAPLERRVEQELDAGARLVILPGLREPPEYESVKERLQGAVWKVTSSRGDTGGASLTRDHANEHALEHLPDEAFDCVLVNDAPDLAGWEEQVEAAIEALRPASN